MSEWIAYAAMFVAGAYVMAFIFIFILLEGGEANQQDRTISTRNHRQ